MKTTVSKLFRSQIDNTLLLGMLLTIVALISFMDADFLRFRSLQSIAFQFPEMGILTLSMMITMITGGINLSCIASANLSGILMAMIITSNIPEGGDNLPVVILAIVVGILASVLVGYANGLIIAYLKVPAILATLGMQMLVNGITLVITRGNIIAGYPKSFSFLGNGDVFGIPMPLIIFAISVLILSFILKKMPIGVHTYMFGTNVSATKFSGVNTNAMLLKVYSLSGLFVGIAAVVLTSRFNSASAGYAESYLLLTVLIAVLGGISPNGGKGRVSGMVLSVIILQVISSGLNLLRVSQYLTTALWGVILILALVIRLRQHE